MAGAEPTSCQQRGQNALISPWNLPPCLALSGLEGYSSLAVKKAEKG